jgi:MOSC domain-containing protein YiiM
VDLLHLPEGTRLHLGANAIVEVTGLRSPCTLLDRIAPGLMQACLGVAPDGGRIRKTGVMGIVLQDGDVGPGDAIRVELPVGPHKTLVPV